MAYAGAGTATPALNPAGALLLLAGGVVLGMPGWLAYAGRWRRWTTGSYGSAFPTFPFGLAWIGAAAVLAGLAALIAALGHVAADIAYIVLGVPAIALFCCGVVFLIGTPRRFQPAWYRDSHRARKGF
jgi:hypothetical protein